MNDENIKRYTKQRLEEMVAKGEDQTDWQRLEMTTDDEIDYSDIPPIPENFWQTAHIVYPQENQEAVSLKVDREVGIGSKRGAITAGT